MFKTFTEYLLQERPCWGSGDTRRSRTPPHLEQRSRSRSHTRKVERRPLVALNKAIWGRVVGLQEEHSVSVPEPRCFAALGSWVPMWEVIIMRLAGGSLRLADSVSSG